MHSTIVESSVYYPENWEAGNWKFIRKYLNDQYNYLVYKRIMDIVTSALVIVFLFPLLFPIITLFIRLDSGGPVFFRQRRVGFLGKTFWCYKFRTMRVNDHADTRRASSDDPRVTRFGNILRNTCLDELPQFINVLLGHMSIVGPRPHMLKDSKEFAGLVSNYAFRNMARPGITGLSQIRGYRGPANNFESVFRRYKWDAYYVRNAGLLLDLRIMTETGLLIFTSLFNKAKPIPMDDSIYNQASAPSTAKPASVKKIA